MTAPDGERSDIAWFPVESPPGDMLEGCPFTTFGTDAHSGRDGLVYPPEMGIPDGSPWGLDPEIADLIVALNRAGLPTVQSCQEISPGQDDGYDGARMGAVVVSWADFPKVAATLPSGVVGNGFIDGWLFAADRDARHVAVIFPWRDCSAWLEAARGLSGDPS
jgi:hypothetical protein